MTKRDERFERASNPFMLQQKLEEIQLYCHVLVMQFPKAEKYRLAAHVENTVAHAMHACIAMKKKYYKKTTLQELDVEVDYLRSIAKLCDTLGYISHGRMNEWLRHLDEAGRIIGGLTKAFKDRA